MFKDFDLMGCVQIVNTKKIQWVYLISVIIQGVAMLSFAWGAWLGAYLLDKILKEKHSIEDKLIKRTKLITIQQSCNYPASGFWQIS